MLEFNYTYIIKYYLKIFIYYFIVRNIFCIFYIYIYKYILFINMSYIYNISKKKKNYDTN